MGVIDCGREQDVLDAVASRRWPDRAGDELRAHVAACAICADLAEVAQALQEEHARVWRDARVPAPGLVWWRAEMRARQEAARTAARPILLAQAVAAACAAGLALALLSLTAPWLRDVDWLVVLQRGLPLAVIVAAWLVVAPVALYLVFSDE